MVVVVGYVGHMRMHPTLGKLMLEGHVEGFESRGRLTRPLTERFRSNDRR